jgi:gamma-glutamyltranspeptidase/glutathione hydrolase
MMVRRLLQRCCALSLVCCAVASAQSQPRGERGWRRRNRTQAPVVESVSPPQLAAADAESTLGMVVSGSPEASEAGARVLAAGGNAVDAAVAAAFAIGVAEPGQSGLGGQTFILVYLADGRAAAIDGSALAPMRVDRNELERLQQARQQRGGAMAATPGTVAALALALDRYGTIPLDAALEPAVELAVFGSRMTVFQRASLEHYAEQIRAAESLNHTYLRDGWDLWGAEHSFCSPELGRTLLLLGERGAVDFYRGEIAREIAAEMIRSGGFVRYDDLARYGAAVREPLRGSYRGHDVLSFPAPCAGGAVIESLHILESFSPELLAKRGVDTAHLIAEAGRIAAFDDHVVRVLDPRASAHQVNKAHAARRAAEINFDAALTLDDMTDSEDGAWRDRDTTHISVVDRFGNAVALTQSLGRGFGSCTGASTLGFPFNSMLEAFDPIRSSSRFSLAPLRPMFTSIAPTIVLRGGRPYLVLGSAGSARIIPIVVSLAVAVIDGKATLAEAQSLPRVFGTGGRRPAIAVEVATPIGQETVEELRRRGFRVRTTSFPATPWDLSTMGGANAIHARPDGVIVGVPDPRRGGLAAGVCAGADGATQAARQPVNWSELLPDPAAAEVEPMR